VADENGVFEVEGVDDVKDVIGKAVGRLVLAGGGGPTGSAEAAAGDGVNVVVGS
jgi:hypothetical protein